MYWDEALCGVIKPFVRSLTEKTMASGFFCTGGSSEVCTHLIPSLRMNFVQMPVVLPVTRTVNVPAMSYAGV